MKRLIYTMLVLFFAVDAYAATLEVGSGKPYSTIQAAVDIVQPGDTVLVYPGTYNQSNSYTFGSTYTTVVHVKTSGTASSPITIKSASSGVVINGGGTINNCFWGRDRSYVIIDGFECTNTNTEAPNPKSGAFYFYKSDHMTIQNNNIHDILQTDFENKASIFLQDTNDSTIKGNNIVSKSIGITVSGSQRTTITNNVVSGNYGGTEYANGMYVTNGSHDTLITKNYIHDYAHSAIQMRDSYRIKFTNNVVYNGHGHSSSSGVCYGVQLRDWPGTGPDGNENDQYQIYNNIVDGSTTYGFTLTQQDNSILANNIVLNVEQAIYETNWAAPVHSTNLTIKNNILNYSSCGLCNFVSVTYTSQSNMEKVDPKFVATGNRPSSYYKLQSSSPAINTGDPSFKVPISWGTIDIGRYEWTSSGKMPEKPENLR